jgi:LAO/AO transport system kinase
VTLADRVLAGDPRAIARAISLIEDEDPQSADLVRAIFSHTGRAYLIGVTGPPGAGKSTLVDRLASELRRPVLDTRESSARGSSERAGATEASGGGAPRALENVPSVSGVGAPAFAKAAARPPELARTSASEGGGRHAVGKSPTLGIIAVDPTSPFSGGAVLGDRLRMQAHAADEGVFIRSMATRGHLGGLARASGDAALVLDAAGKDVIIIETVGVGQDEVDIIRTADVSIVTLVPGTGDEVQALKAGIMEIADIFAVNKADREGADRLVSAVEANLALQTYGADDWRPPIVKTIATGGQGVADLLAAIWHFREHSARTQTARRRTRSEYRLRELVSQRFMDHLEREVLAENELSELVDRIAAREVDPYTAASDLLARALRRPVLDTRDGGVDRKRR